jgi:carbon monoxide dehydrogenase subunit G
MATIYKEFLIDADPDQVWDALRDFGAVHQRVARGFVIDCELEDDARIVTFANGVTLREVLLGIDEHHRRLSYSAVGGKSAHHNASAQVFPTSDGRTRFVWITDVLPNEFAGYVDGMMEQGLKVMQATLQN